MQAAFSERPETFNVVNVVCSIGKLIISVIDSEMLIKANIDQTIVTTLAVRTNNDIGRDSAANNWLHGLSFAIWMFPKH